MNGSRRFECLPNVGSQLPNDKVSHARHRENYTRYEFVWDKCEEMAFAANHVLTKLNITHTHR